MTAQLLPRTFHDCASFDVLKTHNIKQVKTALKELDDFENIAHQNHINHINDFFLFILVRY